MSGDWKELVSLTFQGDRFRDHALDLSSLSELPRFQKIVSELARTLWKAAHPDRERLPARFDEQTRLWLRRIDPGSAVAPLGTYVVPEEQQRIWDHEISAVEGAVDLTYEALLAAENDGLLPEGLPQALLPDLALLGSSLADGEELHVRVPNRRSPARVNSTTRQNWAKFAAAPHPSTIELVGECLEVDVKHGRFQLWTDAKACVQVAFDASQEETVTSALKDHHSIRIGVRGLAEVSPEGKPLRFTAVDSLKLVVPGATLFDEAVPSIETQLAAIWSDVGASEWDHLPKNFTDNLDQHIYGSPAE